jgi:ribosome production factor 1
VPRTLDNMREFDPTILTADPSQSNHLQEEDLAQDLANDPFASYFNTVDNPTTPPKVLITTSPQASKATYDFCDELLGVFPGAEFRRRKKGKGFELGRIAGWAADRGYKHMCVVNEDMKKPSAHLPSVSRTCRLLPFVRCHYINLSPRWSLCLLQVDIYRTYETNIRMVFSPTFCRNRS